MATGLDLTLKTLSRSGHTRATDVLEAALESPDESVRAGAAKAMLERATPRSQSGYLRWLVRQPADRRTPPSELSSYAAALDACLLRGGPEERRIALELARTDGECGRIPSALAVAEDDDEEVATLARETVVELVDSMRLLRDEDRASRGNGNRRNARRADLGRALGALLQTTRRRDAEPLHELAARSILLLGTPKSPEVRELLWTAAPPVRKLATEILLSDEHPGILSFVIDMLGVPYPHPAALEALRSREDRPFVEALLEHVVGDEPPAFGENLHQVDEIRWLTPDYVRDLPDDLQAACVQLVEKVDLDDAARDRFLDWVVRHGSGEARRLATDRLARMDDAEVSAVVEDGLGAENVGVQAWATSQLRSRAVPDAVPRLVERLESPLEPVRAAARRELGDFDLATLLKVHDQLTNQRAWLAGRLLEKINPDVGAELAEELEHPHHRRRLNAVRAAGRLGLGRAVLPQLLSAAEHDDPLIRRTVAECLATIPADEVFHALRRMLHDEHHRVRESARQSLALLSEVSPRTSSDSPVPAEPVPAEAAT